MTRKKILVVDDDPAIRNLVHRFLAQHDFQVESAANGKTALAILERFHPDLVILDVMLPDIFGFEVCRQIKKNYKGVLVVLLTSLIDVESQVTGLDWADAYITKPFHVPVLQKQVQALLRLIQPEVTGVRQERLIFDKLVIDPLRREVFFDNQTLSFTALEFDLLYFLAKHPQQVWSRKELIQQVWGQEFGTDLRVVDVHIGQIRRKIEQDRSQPQFIHTKRGVGYKFEPPASENQSVVSDLMSMEFC